MRPVAHRFDSIARPRSFHQHPLLTPEVLVPPCPFGNFFSLPSRLNFLCGLAVRLRAPQRSNSCAPDSPVRGGLCPSPCSSRSLPLRPPERRMTPPRLQLKTKPPRWVTWRATCVTANRDSRLNRSRLQRRPLSITTI